MNEFRDRLQDLSPAKRALLEKLLRQQAPTAEPLAAIPRRAAGSPPVLSFAEQRLWFVDQLEPDHPFYNLPLAARMTGPLDRAAFAQSLQAVVDRHETLRTTYHRRADAPHREVADKVLIQPQFVDLRSAVADGSMDEAGLQRRLRVEARRPFVLERGPLLRCTVFQLGDTEHVVLLTMHHIVSDGWSMGVMLRELAAYYAAIEQGTAPELPPLAIQYSDFAAWQQQRLDPKTLDREVDFWRGMLQDAPALIDLPLTYPRSPTQDFEGAIYPLDLSPELSQAVIQFARQRQVTPFMIFIAAYAALLARYSQQATISIGTAVANRLRPELEALIGFFVNTLVLPIPVKPSEAFEQLVQQVRDISATAFAHQEIPFEKLVEHLAVDRDRSHSPLFQVAFVLQNTPRELNSNRQLRIEPLPVDNGTAKSDLTFFLWEDESGRFTGHIEYRTSLFSATAISRFASGFQTLLSAAIESPASEVGKLPMVDATEHLRLVDGLNSLHRTYRGSQVMPHAVEEQALATPKQIALVHGDRQLTYGDLVKTADRYGAGWQALGLQPTQAVMVALPRSFPQVFASFSIMRSGAVYVPVDHESPLHRLQTIADDTDAQFIVCPEELIDAWRPEFGDRRLITTAQVEQAGLNQRFRPVDIQPHDLAYMIFTSGSTGTPKGVQIEHRGIMNFLRAKAEALESFGSHDRVMHGFSPCFDGSIAEVYMSLIHGATIVIVDRETFIDPRALTRLLNEQRVSVGMFSPTLLATLDPANLPNVRIVLSAGEALTPELARQWIPGRAMYNGYGPTEVSIGVSMHRIHEPLNQRVPIGRAMANMRLYILDNEQQPVPVGVTGEMYIGGVGVARGYLARPDLNNEKFLPDPFAGFDGARMYRTGDLGRWTDADVAEFMGRRDDQIKLRGFRIELGEIESAIQDLPGVRQVVVVPRGEHSDSRRLIAYVVPEATSEELAKQHEQLENEQVASWKELFEQSHQAAGLVLDRQFDIGGWVSTYTGRPLPNDEMREWVEQTVARVLSLRPRKVLEIGCGTGLILLRAAPQCEHYTGTDLLGSSLAGVSKVLAKQPELAQRVTLHERLADNFTGFNDGQFDVILLNSVVQYFPSADYLQRVLEGAVRVLAPGGKILLGDLRNLRLHRALASSVERSRAEPQTTTEVLKQRTHARLEHEEELLVDPVLFEQLVGVLPRCSGCEIHVKAMRSDNELSRFRYEVVLEFDRAKDHDPTATTGDVTTSAWSGIDSLRKLLLQKPQQRLLIHGIPNARVMGDVIADQWIQDSPQHITAAELELRLNNQLAALSSAAAPVTPAELYQLAEDTGYRLQLGWDNEALDQLNGLLYPRDSRPPQASNRPHVQQPLNWSSFTNAPLKQREQQRATAVWRQALHERLPEYMVPSAFVLLDRLPRTLQGKVDKQALPPPPADRPDWAGTYVAPRCEAERVLVEVWEELLDVRPIGIEDNFFELGGHSMLAVRMVSAVQERLDKNLPLAALFKSPTIEQLAEILMNPNASGKANSLVRLGTASESDLTTTSPALFCIHPAGGTVFCYLPLAQALGEQRPVYGLQAVGIDGQQPPHQTLAEMAAHYARAIREAQPQGPYHITGWSIGGVIAFEVARQLKEQGETLGVLALLDSGLLPGSESMQGEDFLPLITALFPAEEAMTLDDLRQQSVEDQLKYFVQRAAQAGIVPAGFDQLSAHIFQVFQANVKAVHEYLPQAYPDSFVLFRPQDQAKTGELFDDPVLGWREYATAIEVLPVPGDHAHMLQEPAVSQIAGRSKKECNECSHLDACILGGTGILPVLLDTPEGSRPTATLRNHVLANVATKKSPRSGERSYVIPFC